MIIRYVDSGGIFDHHCLNFLFIMSANGYTIISQYLTIKQLKYWSLDVTQVSLN